MTGRRLFTRRQAIATSSAGLAGAMINLKLPGIANLEQDKLAIKGGPMVHPGSWPQWPQWNREAEEGITAMLRTGRWWRGSGEHVIDFEKKYAEMNGVKRCLATSSGTSALLVSLDALGIDAGDEVLVSPFTFVASFNVILMKKALPVFVDSDPDTFLMDPAAIGKNVNERTRGILPVHIYGLPADMDKINTESRKHNLQVIEDACQAWLAVYKGKKVGTLGDLGCFSFQNSKNIPAGEGGAIISNNEALMDRCHSIHNCGRPYGSVKTGSGYALNGGNYRMQQMQALILLSQMEKFSENAEKRHSNAMYLASKLAGIPGIKPVKLAEGAEIPAWHFYPFRFVSGEFDNVSREMFMKALNAEGINCSDGYDPPQKEELFRVTLSSRGFKRLFPEDRIRRWFEEVSLPSNDRLCKEAVIIYQSMLLGSRQDMDDIVNAIWKIYRNRKELV
ncbi:MAG: DegT/DnrJ/EryC1/StrS family aminotransferase [Bacteroidales bacterium]